MVARKRISRDSIASVIAISLRLGPRMLVSALMAESYSELVIRNKVTQPASFWWRPIVKEYGVLFPIKLLRTT